MKNFQNTPFSPVRFPFFYGWMTVFAGTVGILFSIPGQTMGISVFTDHLIENLNISRDTLSIAYLLGTAGSAFLMTYAGKLYDKHGARIVAIGAAAGLASALLMASFSPQLSSVIHETFHLSQTKVAFVVITFAFFVMRFSGQGVLTLSSRNAIMKWFDQRRGLANMISSIFVSLGFSVAPLLFSKLIKTYSWDGAWQMLALAMLGFMLFAFLFYRDNPEESGLIPDGKMLAPKRKKASTFITRKQYTLKEAKKTWAFWAFSGAFAFNSFFITGFTFNIISIFNSNQYSEAQALAIFVPTSIIAITFSAFGNFFSDYINLQKLLILLLVGALLSTLGVSLLNQNFAYYLLIAGNGIMGGMFAVLISVTWPRFYGRKHLGAISGFSSSIIVMASAIGPVFFSRIFSLSGSYQLVGMIASGFVVFLLVLAIKAHNPQLKT